MENGQTIWLVIINCSKKTQALAFNVPSNKLGIPTPSNNIAVVALDNDSIIHSLLKNTSFIYCIIN